MISYGYDSDIINLWYHRQFKTYDNKVNIIILWYHSRYHNIMISYSSTLHLDPCYLDIECRTLDIERNIGYRRLRHRILSQYRRFAPSISYVDIEDVRYRRPNNPISKVKTFDIEGHEQGCPYQGFMPSISIKHCSISHVDIVYDIEGLSDVRYRSLCHNISGPI